MEIKFQDSQPYFRHHLPRLIGKNGCSEYARLCYTVGYGRKRAVYRVAQMTPFYIFACNK